MPTLPACILDPMRQAFLESLPAHADDHPWGCHRPRVDDAVVFDRLVEHLVSGSGYEKVADGKCSATTIRRRRDEWIQMGAYSRLKIEAVRALQKMVGFDLGEQAGDGCITKAPCGGQVAGPSPVDRRKQGMKRSQAVDGLGLPIATVAAGANVPDHLLLPATLAEIDAFEELLGFDVEQVNRAVTMLLDAGYDNKASHTALDERHATSQVASKGDKTPLNKNGRWKVERTNSWMNDFGLLRRMTERRAEVVDLFLTIAEIIITVRGIIRLCWEDHRWPNRPRRKRIRA